MFYILLVNLEIKKCVFIQLKSIDSDKKQLKF